MKKLWSYAREKIEKEGVCRVCKSNHWIQSAHTIGQKYQDVKLDDGDVMVMPDSVIPLCQQHHELYDKRLLDILPYMTNEEQSNAVAAVGIERARKRLTSGS